MARTKQRVLDDRRSAEERAAAAAARRAAMMKAARILSTQEAEALPPVKRPRTSRSIEESSDESSDESDSSDESGCVPVCRVYPAESPRP